MPAADRVTAVFSPIPRRIMRMPPRLVCSVPCPHDRTLQVNEAVKLILGIGELLVGKLLLFNGLDMSFQTILFNQNPDCPVAAKAATEPSGLSHAHKLL